MKLLFKLFSCLFLAALLLHGRLLSVAAGRLLPPWLGDAPGGALPGSSGAGAAQLLTQFAQQAKRRGLISNGEDAAVGSYPYMCALGKASRTGSALAAHWHPARTVVKDTQFCGATLIHPQVVLTAAHCAFNERALAVERSMAVLCNTTQLGATGNGVQFRRVKQVLMQPDSDEAQAIKLQVTVEDLPPDDRGLAAGDVALLLLDQPIEGLPLVALASPQAWAGINSPGQDLMIVGWGATDASHRRSSYPSSLQQATVPLVSPDMCNSDNSYHHLLDPATALCAGFSLGAKSLPCNGDSGGPLLYAPDPSNPASHVQVGIVSGGVGKCGGPSLPGVFTKVSSYHDWIQQGLQAVADRQALPDAAADPIPHTSSGGGSGSNDNNNSSPTPQQPGAETYSPEQLEVTSQSSEADVAAVLAMLQSATTP